MIASATLVLAAANVSPAGAASDGTVTKSSSSLPLTQVIGPAVTVPPHGTSPGSWAVCPAGQTAVSGGWYTWTYDIGISPVQFFQGYTNRPGDSWVAVFENPSNVPGQAGASVYCTP